MHEFQTVLYAVLPVFIIALAGVVMRKLEWLTEEADKSLLRMTINVLSPALIFDSIINNQAMRQPGNIILSPLVGFGTVAFGIGVGWVFARMCRVTDRKIAATLAICAGIYNYGYIPAPLIESLFGKETLGVMFVHNVGVEISFWTVAAATLGGGAGRRWQDYFSPPVIAIIVSLPLNYLGGPDIVPAFVIKGAHMLGQCSVPMGLILVGAMTADRLGEFRSGKGWKEIAISCFLRLGVLPIFFILLAKYLPCSRELKQVIIVEGAMPAATFTVILALACGGDVTTAVRALVGTSVVSLVTIPFWIQVGRKFVGV